MNAFFLAVNQLQHAVMACYIHQNYFDNRYQYDEHIRHARIVVMQEMKKIRQQKNQTIPLAYLESLYEIIFSFNTLKHRVTDHATFEMCVDDFKKIESSLDNIFNKIAHGHLEMDMEDLTQQLRYSIESLDELYRSALQVVLFEPIIFLFFIQNLIALKENIEFIISDMRK